MPDLTGWMTNARSLQPIDVASRAAFTWRVIQRDPTPVILIRDGVLLASQIFRVEGDNLARLEVGGGSPLVTRATLKLTLFGIRDHATLPDSNVKRGDRFSLDSHPGATFEVLLILTPPGEMQALCEAQEGS